jgi:hypothetical protein
MIRLRSLLLLACVVLVVPLLPSASASTAAKPVDALLARQLETASPTSRLAVYVHAKNIGLARDAVKASGLKMIDAFRKIGVAVATGTPAQINKVKRDARAIYVEGNPDLRFFLDTSNIATREKELFEGFEATTVDPQPDVCTTQRQKV